MLTVWCQLCLPTSVQATTSSGDDTYYIRTLVGNGENALKVNVPALEASIGVTRSIVQSKSGDLYIASSTKHVVLKVEFDEEKGTSNVMIVAGTGTLGKGNDNVLGTDSALSAPMGLSLIEDDVTGEVNAILITDSDNYRVRKLDMKTKLINTIAGNGNGVDGGLAIDAKIFGLRQAYYDKSTGDIFIAEYSGHKIRRIFASNGTITTVVGNCTNAVNNGDGGPAIEACLKNPYDFGMNHAGEWFIADANNNLIRKVDLNGIISTVAGGGQSVSGDLPPNEVQLNFPIVIAFAPSGEMLVSDFGNGVVRKLSIDGSVMKTIAGGGTESPSSSNSILAKTASVKPSTVAYTTFGILVGDQNKMRIQQLHLDCFGVKSYDPSVCSGQGTCVASDRCECNNGWLGDDCSSPSVTQCFDIMSNETSVCSGHGTCIGLDQCKCDDGWMQVDCSITHCFGFTSNLPEVCSGKGKCIRPNKCQCDDGFRGHKCQRLPRM